MNARKLELQEHNVTRPLYEEVFSEDSPGFVDYYYEEKTKDNQIYVIEDGGKVCSMLHLNPYQVSVNGSKKDVNYIVAVATRKEYRKRGYMASLLKRALRDMYQAGETFTFLMPASEQIYLPFDFRTVYRQEKRYYREGESVSGEDIEVRPAEESDCEALAECANAYLSRHFQVYTSRDKAYYQRLLKEYASDGGGLMLDLRDGRIVDVRIRAEEEKEKPKIMVRILDVRRMLMSLRVRSLIGVCFTVADPIIEENNRCVLITGTEFSGVMLMEGKQENSEGTITIAALASLIFGAKTVDETKDEAGVIMSDRMQEELRKLVPLTRICLNEVV